jgi:hypothetical protein
MSNFADNDILYDNYIRGSDFNPQPKLKKSKSRERDTNKVIPEIVQQREKERKQKKEVKLKLSAKNKNFAIMRAQSRTASGRSQLVNFNEIENDNDLADELTYELHQQCMFCDEWYY